MSEIILTIEGIDPILLFGERNNKLNLLQEAFPELVVTARGNTIKIVGAKKQTQLAKARIESMIRWIKKHEELSIQTVKDLLAGENIFESKLSKYDNENKVLVYGQHGKVIRAKTVNQKRLIDSSEKNDIVFAVGPAGTGKTYTAVALAVRALKNRLVKKIILTRPAVEAGESLGFLPGDMKDKIDPYLRPLYDALDDMLPAEKLNYFMQTRVIEIAPLAFMRGRTLDNAFIILDESQNTTSMQIKMFLTRLGPNAKCIITGDLSQVDLPYSQKSGLRHAMETLGNIKGIGIVHLTAEDVVRHRLVREIILAYDRANHKKKYKKEEEE